MPFTIAHSPDSDDAYMMAPLALGWLDPEGFDLRFVRKDIETLNGEALDGRYEVTAISFGAYPELVDSYELLTAGSSIQEGTGPLVIARTPMTGPELRGVTMAIPGLRTALTLSKFETVLEKCGAAIVSQTPTLVPADRVLYALRDRTGTVESPGLICASILK